MTTKRINAVEVQNLRSRMRAGASVYVRAPAAADTHTHACAPSPAPPPSTRGVGERAAVRRQGLNNEEETPASKTTSLDVLVAALSVADRKELLARLSLDASGIRGEERDVDMWAGAVYEALLAFEGQGAGAGQGPMVVKRLVGASNAWAPVSAFMKASKLDNLPVTQRQSVYVLLARLLVQHAAGIADYTGAPFTVKLVSNCTNAIRGVFDHAFPGYVSAGLAHIVARRLTTTRHQENPK